MGHEDEVPPPPEDGEKPSAIDKIHNSIEFSMTDPAEISTMRAKLIRELKTPFIRHVNAAPSYSFIKEVKIENFDERVMTLPDREVFDLYSEYLKIRTIRGKKAKEEVREGILKRLEVRILSDGQFLRQIFRRRKK